MFEENENLEAARVRNVRDALREDIGRCDWTAQLLPAGKRSGAHVVAKEPAVLCGRSWFDMSVMSVDPKADIEWFIEEGEEFDAGSRLCRVEANSRALMSAERTALNFLQMMSSVATAARAYVRAIDGASPNQSGCVVLDTRKTLPGLRQAQKYAVRTGGASNHRMALWDGILIKENHVLAAGSIAVALREAANLESGVDVQIEVETLDELDQALMAGAKSVLLDDFTLGDMRRAVQLNAGRAVLEVSGGVSLETIRDIAATGVDRISVGKLTKDVRAVDLSWRGDGNAE